MKARILRNSRRRQIGSREVRFLVFGEVWLTTSPLTKMALWVCLTVSFLTVARLLYMLPYLLQSFS